jgi:hypothetical protein
VPKKIDAAVRERALRLFVDNWQDYPSDTALVDRSHGGQTPTVVSRRRQYSRQLPAVCADAP